MALEPGDRVVARGVEEYAAALEEDHPVDMGEHHGRPVLGEDDGGAGAERVLEERLGAVGVELRGRLVQQEQARFQRERRGQADALELAAGQLGHPALREMLGADRRERGTHARGDCARRRGDVLEPERDLGLDPPEHDLILGILEHGRHRPRELCRPGATRVAARDLDPSLEAAAVEPRHEAGERTQKRRLARAGRAEQQDDLARLDREAHSVQRRPGRGVREPQAAHSG